MNKKWFGSNFKSWKETEEIRFPNPGKMQALNVLHKLSVSDKNAWIKSGLGHILNYK